MDINDIFTKGLDLNEALDLLWPVSIYVLSMAAYAIFVFRVLSVCGCSGRV